MTRLGKSALILATINNNFDAVKNITKFGANLKYIDLHNKSALDYAIINKNIEIINLLISLDA